MLFLLVLLSFILYRYLYWRSKDYQEQQIMRNMKPMSPDDIQFFRQTDKSVEPVFLEYAEKHGLSTELVHKYATDSALLLKIIVLKLWYLRMRPPVKRIASVTAYGPSYPSGHAVQAFNISKHLSLVYPEHKEALTRLAEKSANIRVIGGMHYPSDIKIDPLISYL